MYSSPQTHDIEEESGINGRGGNEPSILCVSMNVAK